MIFGWVLVIVSAVVVIVTLLAARGLIAPNGLIGIRTRATRQDMASWRLAHRSAAWVLVPGCAITAVLGLLIILGAIGGNNAGEYFLLGFLILVGIAALVADRAARGARSI